MHCKAPEAVPGCVCFGGRVPTPSGKHFSSTSGVLQFGSVWHCPPADSIRGHTPPRQMPVPSPGASDLPAKDWRFSFPFSLGSIYLLEQLTELKETLYSLARWLIINGYSAGAARWERCRREGEGHGFHALCCTALPQASTCSPPRKDSELILSGFYGDFITWAWWNHWPPVDLTRPSALLGAQGRDWKF